MYNRLLLAIAVAFVWTSGAASAAPLLSVSYDVTGGTFHGPWSSGAITGGSVVFTPVVPTSTPGNIPGTWYVHLLGPAGTVQMTLNSTPFVFAEATPRYVYAIGPAVLTNFISNGLALPTTVDDPQFYFEDEFGIYGATIWARGGACPPTLPDCDGMVIYHGFGVGNEVRTFVPEPATGALVGLGLLLMAFVGGSRGAAARARRARRS